MQMVENFTLASSIIRRSHFLTGGRVLLTQKKPMAIFKVLKRYFRSEKAFSILFCHIHPIPV